MLPPASISSTCTLTPGGGNQTPTKSLDGFNPWVGKIPWRRERVPTPIFWPGEFHGLYSPWGCKESDTTERLSLSGFNVMVLLIHNNKAKYFFTHQALPISVFFLFLERAQLMPTGRPLLLLLCLRRTSCPWIFTGWVPYHNALRSKVNPLKFNPSLTV